MFEVYSKLRQVMEDKLLELLRNFYPTETFDGRNAPTTTQRIQELIRRGEGIKKGRIVLSTWHSTSMYQWLRQHADSYQAYSPRIYINEAPNDLTQELNFILRLQEKLLNFTLLPAYLFEKKVHGLVHHYDSGIPTFGKFLFGHSAPDQRIKLL